MTTQHDALKQAMDMAYGCFEAAFVEGLHDALSESQDERLKDLVQRRLLWAVESIAEAQATLSQQAAQEQVTRYRMANPDAEIGDAYLCTEQGTAPLVRLTPKKTATESIANSYGGFAGGYAALHGRSPTQQEAFDAGVKSGMRRAQQAAQEQEPVGVVVHDSSVHGWHMQALMPWECIGAGTKLYATASAKPAALLDYETRKQMRRAAEDARDAMNARLPKFIEAVAHPLNILKLLDMVECAKPAEQEKTLTEADWDARQKVAAALGLQTGMVQGKRIGFGWEYLLGLIEDMVKGAEAERQAPQDIGEAVATQWAEDDFEQAPAVEVLDDELARKQAWKKVKREVGTEGWTVGDNCTYYGFFMWGWRAALSTPPAASSRNWTEDSAHENGNYKCRCVRCSHTFFGHKRRVVCKVCAAEETGSTLDNQQGETK